MLFRILVRFEFCVLSLQLSRLGAARAIVAVYRSVIALTQPPTTAKFPRRSRTSLNTSCLPREDSDIECLRAAFCESRRVTALTSAELRLDADRASQYDDLYGVKIACLTVTKAAIYGHKMAFVMAVQNLLGTVREPSVTSVRRGAGAIVLLCTPVNYQVINALHAPRGGQAAMRGKRLRSSPRMTDRVMRWGNL